MKTRLIAISSLLLGSSVALGIIRCYDFFSKPLLIQSLESKTILGEPVFNEIKWFEYPDKDVWMMNQSHFGKDALPEKKDRVVIVIDKTKTPKSAYFMQISPGPLEWSEDLYTKKVANKVSCFICHANGLRALRASPSSKSLDAFSWVKKNYLNYKINSYGLVVENERHTLEDKSLVTPFRIRTVFDNEVLQLKICSQCHDGKIRGQLTRQNAVSIQFLLESKMMPPPKTEMTLADLKRIKNFLNGL